MNKARAKLIDILQSKPYGHSTYEEMTDYLLANGVTVLQEIKGPVVVQCNMIMPREYHQKQAEEFANRLRAGALVLPPWYELLAEVPAAGNIQIVAEAQVDG